MPACNNGRGVTIRVPRAAYACAVTSHNNRSDVGAEAVSSVLRGPCRDYIKEGANERA
jgi:hypothetical protein